jgi:hypothetical protein
MLIDTYLNGEANKRCLAGETVLNTQRGKVG